MNNNNSKKRPNIIGRWIIDTFIPDHIGSSGTGDYEELYQKIADEKSRVKASLWFWGQILKSIPLFIFESIIWSFAMLKNYFKITLRNLFKYKGYSIINITGFAIGIACCFLILLFVQDELSYDRYHKNADRIYRVCIQGRIANRDLVEIILGAPAAETLVNEYPEVENAVRIYQPSNKELLVKYENKQFTETRFLFTDESIFDVFTFQLIEGNPETVLEKPNSVLITESTAKKYFGKENAVGKTITVDNSTDFLITGIVEEVPSNSHFHFDFLASFNTLNISRSPSWLSFYTYTYILLKEGINPADLETKFPELIRKHIGPQISMAFNVTFDQFLEAGNRCGLFLQPITDIHLHSHYDDEFEPNSDIKYVFLFSVIAVFILLIACVNFMNLSTAKSGTRVKEIGVRKVLGSARKQLILQFLAESVFLTFISVMIALLLVKIFLPAFNNLAGKQIEIYYMKNLLFIPVLFFVIILVSILAGSYPAFFLSSFNPVSVVQKKLNAGLKGRSFFRSVLVVFQFSISIILLISTYIVYNQIVFMQNKELGFEKEQVFVISRASGISQRIEEFKQEIAKHPDVMSSTASGTLPGKLITRWGFQIPGESADNIFTISRISADTDYAKTLNLEIAEGRFFSKEFSADNLSVLINESAVAVLGFKEPIGRQITRPGQQEPFTIIGILKDFHFESLHKEIQPLVLLNLSVPGGRRADYISIRIKPGNPEDLISFVKNKWQEFLPGQPFDYFFLDSHFDSLYKAEQRTQEIFFIFAVFAIFISCLGLFGLASYTAERRTKEIGIRKVMGASVPNILVLLTRDFSRWILIANIIAWPAAWYVMNSWIQNFAYRTPISWNIFLISGIFAFIIAILTVSYQVIKSATANPARSIGYE